MSDNPEGPDRDVTRPRRESGKPAYPFIILVIIVTVAVVGIILTL